MLLTKCKKCGKKVNRTKNGRRIYCKSCSYEKQVIRELKAIQKRRLDSLERTDDTFEY